MLPVRRALVCLILATLLSLVIYYRAASSSVTLRALQSKVPQIIGLGEYFEAGEQHDQDGQNGSFSRPANLSPPDSATNPSANGSSATGVSSILPLEAKFTRNLIMARMTEENVTWLDEVDLGPEITKMIYIADDLEAPLHPPKNKGHEVMTYLTYIIDFYDDLPDVSIFMHSHRNAWHNNDLLNWDSGEMIRRLSSERVQRQGYMNMRCHWMPGCPEWIHPGQIEEDREKLEQSLMADAWAELFADKPIPAVLAQPCCSQFALSREKIGETPVAKYEHYRDWLLRSEHRDTMSGRIFEYLWQVIFTDQSVFCPNQRTCYCDGYGVCFETDETFDKWFELRWQKKTAEKELGEWQEKADHIEKFRTEEGRLQGIENGMLEVPEIGKKEQLNAFIDVTAADLERRRLRLCKEGGIRGPERRAQGVLGKKAMGSSSGLENIRACSCIEALGGVNIRISKA